MSTEDMLHAQACFSSLHVILYMLYWLSAKNIFQLMNHNPNGAVIHFIHAHFCTFLDPPLRTLLFKMFSSNCCHMGDTSATQVRTQYNYHWFMHHTSRAEWDRLLWNVACQNTVIDRDLMAHSSVASASCCLHQLLFDRKGFFLQCAKTQLST